MVGFIYVALAMWCSLQPSVMSAKVGFQLKPGSGESEFVTVYGGLEFGLALVILSAAFRPKLLKFGVQACVLIHVSLVVFRSISLIRFSGIEAFTYQLAAGEWAIAIAGLAILFTTLRDPERQSSTGPSRGQA